MIHPTAIIAPGAQIGERVDIGPFAVVDEHVELGDGSRVGPHVYLTGFTRIGAGADIHTGAVIGDEPQDTHFEGGRSYTEIGRDCVLREYVTIHRGSDPETKTVVGDGVMLMALSHIGHNCVIGNSVVIANATLCAGHVQVGDRAFISGNAAVHQFVRIGALAMVSGGSLAVQDIPPYCIYQHQAIRSENVVGLRRAGIAADARKAIRGAVKLFFFSGLNRPSALDAIREQYGEVGEVDAFVAFIEGTKRGIAHSSASRRQKPASEEN